MQVVVDRHKCFNDISVGMLRSPNNVHVIRRSTLYTLATTNNLFDLQYVDEGFVPYLLGDMGYLFNTWLVTPCKDLSQGGVQSVEDKNFYQKLRTRRCIIENAFGILKGVFRELSHVMETHIMIVPDMIVACCLLHNLLLDQSPNDVAKLLEIINREGAAPNFDDNPKQEAHLVGLYNMEFQCGDQKQTPLACYLIGRQNLS